ncbi:ankyrin repeat-containing domain protein [Coprinopsis sp. MPI-PUGE-AT-0042]|nr:ankyrin repeat-containing domain protein [Coprinopsis sp. MPI-PUGE-AT-0042]
MACNPIRKGSVSRDQDSTTTRGGQWEVELAGPPSECSPTASGSALISGVESAQIHGGTFHLAGRDVVHHHTYNYGPQMASVDVLKILNSLSLPNSRDIQLDTLAKATDGTCIWLTKGEMFVFWIKHGKILWGIGIPGAGKTVLASIVIHYLEGLENKSGGIICVAYVYLRYSEPFAVRDILESLVKQIVERHVDLIPLIEALYARLKKERTKPSQQDLVEVLEGFVRHGKTLFFVLDALDEMRAEDRPILLRFLASLDAKLFITSRPLEPLQKQFHYARVFSIAASPSDLNLHIKNFLRRSPEVVALIEGTDLEEQIAETIHRKSGGMFLHATLQLETLRSCVSALNVEETLQAFPTGIEAIYAKTWERILAQGPEQSNLATLVLLWVTHADGEMTIDTLQRAVATCPETHAFEPKRMVPEALLLSVCCGLVSVDEKTKLARLIHSAQAPRRTQDNYTARDTILSQILGLYPVPHALLGQVCIAHVTQSGLQHFGKEAKELHSSDILNALNHHDVSTELGKLLPCHGLKELLHNDTLLAYAYRSWVYHTRQCGRYTPITAAAADLVLNCTSYPLNEGSNGFGGPFNVAAFYGLEDLIPLAAGLHSPNSCGRLCQPPLLVAAQRGHIGCVKALLSLPGINVNPHGHGGSNAASTAEPFVQLLALFSNTTELVGKETEDRFGWTPLMHAVAEGHTEIVKELLSAQGIDVNRASFGTKETALTVAASRGQINIVKQLLDVPRINVNAVSKSGKTALSCALAKGHREIVDLLLAIPGIIVPASMNLF